MKININIELPETLSSISPEVKVQTSSQNDYHNKPPYKGIMIVKARRMQDKNKPDAREYQFRYNPEEYPEVNGSSKGIPLVCGQSSVRVNPNKFWPNSPGLLPFRIYEHDNYPNSDGVIYPVMFEVFDFEWEENENS